MKISIFIYAEMESLQEKILKCETNMIPTEVKTL